MWIELTSLTAKLLVINGEYVEAIRSYQRLLDQGSSPRFSTLHNMAACYFSLRDYQTAKSTLEKALSSLTGDEHPEALATAYESLA